MTTIFTLYVHGFAHKEEELTEFDNRSLEDLLTIAIEIMNDVKQYDPSVLNPITFMQLSLVNYGLERNPSNKTFLFWQAKIYGKLGLVSLVTEACNKISKPEGTG